MRFHGKRILRQRFDRLSREKVESRDAIVWDIIQDQRMARVKIQGSNELLNAHYQEGVEYQPIWLRPGSPVRIIHRGGIRGRFEIQGLGHVIPTPLEGGSLPPRETVDDGILTGMQVVATTVTSMFVLVREGTYRINGVIYTLTAGIIMTASSDFLLGMGGVMGDGAVIVAIDPAPAVGYWRYDLICIAEDGVVDYIAGTPATTDPVRPEVPSSHIQIAYILVPGGATAILQSYINAYWTNPQASMLEITFGDSEILWADPIQTWVKLQIKDQYSMNFSLAAPFTLQIIGGNGQIYSAETGWSETAASGTGTGSYTFQYLRNKTVDDHSPILEGRAITTPVEFTAGGIINLYDESGDWMPSF